MRWVVFGMLVVMCLLMIISYSLLVMVSREEERAERMYRAWKESKDERLNKTE